MFSYYKTSSYLEVKEVLREKYLYSELFWSVFSRIWTEYREILRTFLYSVRMRENAANRTVSKTLKKKKGKKERAGKSLNIDNGKIWQKENSQDQRNNRTC